MKLKHIYLYLLTIITGIILFAAFSSNRTTDDNKGNKAIIKFSHKTHNGNADCTDCHTAVTTSKSLKDRLMPSHDDCKTCHDVEDEKKCSKCHYEGINEPLIQKKSELNFNHSSHLAQKNVKCETCHKGIWDVAYAEDAPQAFPAMETCYSCHNNTSVATNVCTTCHAPNFDLKPQSHKSASFISTHKFAAKQYNANCVMCHDNASCQECHTATTMITESNTSKDFYTPYSPSNNGNGGVKQQQITRVHNLNYVYTHGIDAQSHSAECQSCHQEETFCTNCHHAKEGDYSQGGIAPASHLKSTFMVIGVGSGGGDHAALARRNIESCAACHDTQGGDPTCIKCHIDPDGIQGTNPKTHPSNFMKDVHGDWHDSQGSICFNCHTGSSPSSPAGVGFCGYCHGSNPH
ncbi:MAG: cytochrome c3 family protein [Bacteroidetes bacterium]|nr:cytochrome c3 family protein [Bacteroidota bacterium]